MRTPKFSEIICKSQIFCTTDMTSTTPEPFAEDKDEDVNEQQPLLNVHANHESVINECKLISIYFIIAAWTGVIQVQILASMWILLAKSLTGYSLSSIGIIIIVQQIARICALLASSYICDRFGFDRCILATSTIVVIAMVIACTSYSILQLAIAIILEAIAGFEVEVICTAFVVKILPMKYSAIYLGYLRSSLSSSVLIGFVFAGIFSAFFEDGYRIALYFALGITVGRWIFIWLKIRGTQQSIIDKQMEFIQYYEHRKQSNDDQSDEDIFPVCLEYISGEISAENQKYFFIFESPSLATKSVWYFLDLMVHLLLWGLGMVFILSFNTWYFVLLVDRFGVSTIIPALQAGFCAVLFGVTLMPVSKFGNNWSQITQYCVLIVCAIVRIFLFIFGFNWNFNDKYGYELYWIWYSFCTISWAFGILLDFQIMKQQPKLDVAKVTAIKMSLMFAVSACVSYVIALYWESISDYYIFGYAFAVVEMVSIVIFVFLIVVKLFWYGFSFSPKSVL